jgi:large subunit ribosomal protein L14e
MIMEPGRVCIKLAGREAGTKCVVVEAQDKNFVVVLGEGIRRRRCNISHLEPTNEILKLKKGGSDKEILKSLK